MSESPTDSNQTQFSLVRFLANRVDSLVVAAVLVLLFSYLAQWFWISDLACHFRLQLSVCILAGALALLLLRRWKSALVATLFIVPTLVHVVGLYVPRVSTGSSSELRVLFANVLTHNREFDRVIDLVEEESPDVIVLIEVDQGWLDGIADLNEAYPHQCVQPRDDNFGIALLSRVPLRDPQVQWIGDPAVPLVSAIVDVGGAPMSIVGVHVVPPVSAHLSAARDDQLIEAAKFAQSIDSEVLLVGDLNATSFAPIFSKLKSISGCRDSREGFGWQTTWLHDLWPLKIPIDHALVSGGIQVNGRRVADDVGSDHLPVVVDVSLAD